MQSPYSDQRTMRFDRALSGHHVPPFGFVRRSCFGALASICLPALAPTLCRKLSAAEPVSKWPFEVSSGLFRIHADFEIAPQGELLSELSRLSGEVAELLELEKPRRTIHVVIFGSPEEYRRYMAHYYPALPARRALFIQQRGTGMLFAHRHPDLATDLRHETVHAMLNDGTAPLPLWLDEGLAEYFEVPSGERWSGHSHLPAVRMLKNNKAWTDLATLEALQEISGMSTENYRDSWSWVHFLLHRRNSTRRIFVENLQSLRIGKPVPPLSRTIAKQIPDWRSEFSDHFQQLGRAS